jgi:hypothetical protein
LVEYTFGDWLGSACVRHGEYLSWPGTMSRRLAEQQPPHLTPHPRHDRVAALVPPGRPAVRSSGVE